MKTNKTLMTVFVFLSTLNLSAWGNDPYSAKRELGTPYTLHFDELKSDVGDDDEDVEIGMEAGKSVISTSRLYRGSSSVGSAPSWGSYAEVASEFRRVRDARHLRTKTSFPRRTFWFYPDDGCYVRAALMNRLSYLSGKKTPGKVFAFGNLRIRTSNSPRGAVGWWYHVAPIVQVGSTKYVFDPSIEISRPLTLDEWLGRMGKPQNIKVAVCSSGAYVPGSQCGAVSRGESYAVSHASTFLDREWKRVLALKRSPQKDLGPNPPWYRGQRTRNTNE